MNVDVITRVQIARPRRVVAGYACDPSNAPTWYANIRSVEWKSQLSLQVGSEVAFVAQFLGKRLSYTYRVVEYEPEELLTMSTAEGPFPMETTYRFVEVGPQRTRMELQSRGAPSGFSRVVAPVMVSAMKRANQKDLQALRAILEG